MISQIVAGTSDGKMEFCKRIYMGLQLSKIYHRPGSCVEHYYLCNYIPSRLGSDRLSRSLIRFKEALALDLQAWIDCSVHELKKLQMPGDVIVMRALGSEETTIDKHADTPLDKLGKSIAKAFKVKWLPQLISKPKQTRPMKYLDRMERRHEIKHAYYLSEDYFDFDDKRILLIDNIVTTGSTVVSIIRLIKEYFPSCRFKVYTLARTSHETPQHNLHLSGSAYTWEVNSGWMVAEEKVGYNSYLGLCACILNDSFQNLQDS